MEGHTLDYAAVAPGYLDLFARVLRRDRLLHVKLVGRLLLGAAATSVAPLVVAGVLMAALHRAQVRHHPSLTQLTLLASIIVVPLLFLLERRTRGEFFIEASRAQNPGRYERAANYFELSFASGAATLAAWVELSLWGPRMMIDTWTTLRTR